MSAAWGLSRSAVRAAHHRYLVAVAVAVAGVAVADGTVTDREGVDLELVAQLLGVGSDDLDAALDTAARGVGAPTRAPKDLTGLTVCFTGAFTSTLEGVPITRPVAEHLAVGAGCAWRRT